MTAARLDRYWTCRTGERFRRSGVVTTRQRPETANGVIFMSLEDEEGEMQLIVYRTDSEKRHLRPAVLGARLMVVKGRWQRQGKVCNIIAGRLKA